MTYSLNQSSRHPFLKKYTPTFKIHYLKKRPKKKDCFLQKFLFFWADFLHTLKPPPPYFSKSENASVGGDFKA